MSYFVRLFLTNNYVNLIQMNSMESSENGNGMALVATGHSLTTTSSDTHRSHSPFESPAHSIGIHLETVS